MNAPLFSSACFQGADFFCLIVLLPSVEQLVVGTAASRFGEFTLST
jgi:hypothetical protein